MKIISETRVNKVQFYARAVAQHLLVPNSWYRARLKRRLECISDYDEEVIQERVDYYNKFSSPIELTNKAMRLKDISSSRKTAYYYDLRSLLRYFPESMKVSCSFGDISRVQDEPILVKSRPVMEGNANNILLKLNAVRHFLPIYDPFRYEEKKDRLVWRGAAWKKHRQDLLRSFWNHSLCDVGQVNPASEGIPSEWVKPKMSIAEQLQYKFILSIEGNDVATNLKWIAQSNSLCFMTKPKFETWMMEGQLQAGVHYVELQKGYSDLPEKMEYYIQHPDEAKLVIQNLQRYYRQFQDLRREELIGLLVMKKYLRLTGQEFGL